MGQPIEVSEPIVAGDVLVLDTNRSISGQDGAGFARDDDPIDSAPGVLAARIFERDDSVDHVFVASAQVVARRPGGWDSESIEAVTHVVAGFFVFYSG